MKISQEQRMHLILNEYEKVQELLRTDTLDAGALIDAGFEIGQLMCINKPTLDTYMCHPEPLFRLHGYEGDMPAGRAKSLTIEAFNVIEGSQIPEHWNSFRDILSSFERDAPLPWEETVIAAKAFARIQDEYHFSVRMSKANDKLAHESSETLPPGFDPETFSPERFLGIWNQTSKLGIEAYLEQLLAFTARRHDKALSNPDATVCFRRDQQERFNATEHQLNELGIQTSGLTPEGRMTNFEALSTLWQDEGYLEGF